MLNQLEDWNRALSLARNSRQLFPMNGSVPLHVLHDANSPPISAREFLLQSNIDPEIIDQYLNEEGIWSHEKNEEVDITGQTPESTYQILEPYASPLLHMSMLSLLEAHKYTLPNKDTKIGLFTDHTYRNHIYYTHNMVQDFMIQRGITDTQTLADAAAQNALHDTFNFLSRGIHNVLAARAVKRMFPNLTGGDRQRMRDIQSGILLHNEPIYRDGPLQLTGLPFRKKVEKMQQWHPPMSAALLLADKAEIRRDRVIPQALRAEIVDVHSHTRSNLYTNFLNLGYRNEMIQIDFSHDPWVHIENQRYAELADGAATQEYDWIYAPPHLKNEHGRISMEKVYKELWQLYGPHESYDADRLSLMLAAGFVLFPDAKAFGMTYTHKYDPTQVIHQEFELETADEQLATLIQP